MDISAAPPQRIPDLLRFLRQMGYAVEEVEYAVVEVDVETVEEELSLSRRLLVWSTVNHATARVIA